MMQLGTTKPRQHEVRALALSLMAQWGLTGWSFRFNRRRRSAGTCFFPYAGEPGRIELSAPIVERNSLAEIRDSILHEIAHALAFLHDGEKGHGPAWRKWCLKVGAMPERLMGEHMVLPEGRWRAECPVCHKVYHRHRRPRRGLVYFCRVCGPMMGVLKHRDVRVHPA